jgi:murein DD-endopeptidase MepM/ murein hydrolase activator NlpD
MRRRKRANRRGSALWIVVLVLTAAAWAPGLSAAAQESPSPTENPSPTESPSPTGSPSSTESPSASESPSPSDTPTATPDPGTPSWSPDPGSPTAWEPDVPPSLRSAAFWSSSRSRHDRFLRGAEGRRHGHRRDWRGWAPDPRWGTYGTAKLDRAAATLRRDGWSEERIATRVYTPFLVEGPATWSDSWGAPRWAGGYHPHHGQDVLCRYGAPVLAVDRGEIVFGSDPLGGRTAYLTLPDGGFWYYAHLKAYAKDLASHDPVRPGRVIGYCGASGDATVPHVHFAYFDVSHRALDPMPALVAWLHAAERRLGHDRSRPPDPLPDPVSLLEAPRPLDQGSAGPFLTAPAEEPDTQEAIPPKAGALGVAAVLCLACASMGTAGARRWPRRHRPEDPAQVGGPPG